MAGGSSARFGGEVPKQFREVAGRPLLSWTIGRFEAAETIDRIVVVAPEEYLLHTSQRVIDPYGFQKVQKVVVGGEYRQASVRRGLEALPISVKTVAIHDGARPLVAPEDIDNVVRAAQDHRAAILAAKIPDTIKRVEDGFVLATLDRSRLYGAQTPQAFQFDLILEAHRVSKEDEYFTDDAAMIETMGFTVRVVEPTRSNFKITTKADLEMAEVILSREVT